MWPLGVGRDSSWFQEVVSLKKNMVVPRGSVSCLQLLSSLVPGEDAGRTESVSFRRALRLQCSTTGPSDALLR